MKTEELQIGDLVRVNKDVCIKNGTIVRVVMIDSQDSLVNHNLKGSTHCVDITDEYHNGGVWAAYLDPIPLTDDILKKNGFEYKHRNIASLSGCKFAIAMVKWPDEYGFGGLWVLGDNIEIRYVHELQHALRLCHINKDIIL